MMTTPARVKEADIMRAARTAKRIGASKIHIGPDGGIDIVLADGQIADRLSTGQPAEQEGGPLVRIRHRPLKKVVL